MIMLFRRMGAALKKRQFGQMFYEFMLIFLAVMAGFAAENWRENLEDRKRLKEYLTSMRNDLQADQQEAQRISTKNNEARADIRFIVEHLYGSPNDSQLVELYKKARFINRKIYSFIQRDQVYAQMKSAGDLRLIGNKTLADSIAGYYFRKTMLEELVQTRLETSFGLLAVQNGVFESRIFYLLSADEYDTATLTEEIKRLQTPLAKQGIGAYVNYLQYFNGICYLHNVRYVAALAAAQRLEALVTAELKRLE